jgi:LysM repeat protein
LDIIGPGTRFGVGINFNIFMRGLDGNIDTKANGGYFINGLKTSGIGIDLGFIYVMNVNMILGFSIDNLIEPNVAFNKDLAEEAVEKNYKIGLSWKKERLWRFKYVTIAGGVSFENLKSDVWEYRIGYEFWEFDRVMGIRIGYETSDRGMNILGLGLTGRKSFGMRKTHEIEVNYGFNYPVVAIKQTYGNHTFSLVYRYSLPEYLFEFDIRKRVPMRERYEKEGKAEEVSVKEEKREEKPLKEEKQPKVSVEQEQVPAGEIKIHIVGEGDNLMKISKMYYGSNKYWQKLAEYNGLKPPNYPFRVGQQLKIPPVSELEK